jgi:hypothetical protein
VIRRRADKLHACRLARSCERRALGQKAVAGVNRVDPLLAGDCDQRFDIQVRAHRLAALRRTDQECLVGLEAMQ